MVGSEPTHRSTERTIGFGNMMTPTHALAGASVGASVAAVDPALSAAAIPVGFVAGVLPDIDLLWDHRRTTHFPVYAPAVALAVVALAAVVGGPLATLFAVGAVAFAVHPAMDVLCGGIECRPWEATSERAVYDHARGRWLRPRRLVRYAGAPEDLLAAAVAGLPALTVATGYLQTGLVAVLAGSAAFVAVRRRLAGVSERLFADRA